MVDWSLGRYEHTAAQLEPAARALVSAAAPAPGTRVLDVGCGTGNAALLAAEAGAKATGVDPAVRLLAVARRRAAIAGLTADFREGVAEDLPVGDASFDVVVSVFGVIFATDAQAAIAELARVRAPQGRVLITTWLPEGAIARCSSVMRGPRRGGFGWHDPAALQGAFASHGLEVTHAQESLAFTAASPEAYLDAEIAAHPMFAAGGHEERREQMLAVLTEGNEDPAAFRATSRYLIVSAS